MKAFMTAIARRSDRAMVEREADRLLEIEGERGFGLAGAWASAASRGGNPAAEQFWIAVARELSRRIKRDALLRVFLAQPGT